MDRLEGHLLPEFCCFMGPDHCAGFWSLLLMSVMAAGLWLIFREARGVWRWMSSFRPWWAPVLLLGAGGLLLLLPQWGDIRLPDSFFYFAQHEAKADTRCEHPELSGVTLSDACQFPVLPQVHENTQKRSFGQ